MRVGFGTPEYLAVQEKFALVEGVDGNGQRVMAKHATLANSILSIFRLQNSTQMVRTITVSIFLCLVDESGRFGRR